MTSMFSVFRSHFSVWPDLQWNRNSFTCYVDTELRLQFLEPILARTPQDDPNRLEWRNYFIQIKIMRKTCSSRNSRISQKAENQCSREVVEGECLFGRIEAEKEKTLLAQIDGLKWIKPGTTIVQDCWKVSVNPKKQGNLHNIVKGAVSPIIPSAPKCSSCHRKCMLWVIRFLPSHRSFSRPRNHSTVSLTFPLGNLIFSVLILSNL